MRIVLKLCMIVALFLCTMGGYAQSVGDRLFAQGQKLQMVQTVKSQNLAISKFIAAQKAYDSSAKKSMCDNQIAICRSNIKTLNQKQTIRKQKVRKQKVAVVKDDSVAIAPKKESQSICICQSLI